MFSRTPLLINFNFRSLSSRLSSSSSAKAFSQSDVQVSLTDDGKTIVMYHPETTFPYEHTKPLPEIETKFKEDDKSVLKLVSQEDITSIMFKKDLTEEDLMRKTNSSRVYWDQYACKRRFFDRRKVMTSQVWINKDREGL